MGQGIYWPHLDSTCPGFSRLSGLSRQLNGGFDICENISHVIFAFPS